MGKKHFCFFQTAETGNRTPNSGVKGSGANHYPRAPAQGTIQGKLNLKGILKMNKIYIVDRFKKYINIRIRFVLNLFEKELCPSSMLIIPFLPSIAVWWSNATSCCSIKKFSIIVPIRDECKVGQIN